MGKELTLEERIAAGELTEHQLKQLKWFLVHPDRVFRTSEIRKMMGKKSLNPRDYGRMNELAELGFLIRTEHPMSNLVGVAYRYQLHPDLLEYARLVNVML
jgi:hypothetical protein